MDSITQLIADARRGGWRFWRHGRRLRGAFVELADSTKNVELEKQLQTATQQLAEVNFRLNAVNGVMQTTQKELEEARAGNKKLADWIATTHRVDLKSTLGMKLFSAAKKATVLFVLCAGMDAAAQVPGYQRNPVTTNSITNGVISWVLTWFGPTLIGWSPMTGGSGSTGIAVLTNGTLVGVHTNLEFRNGNGLVVTGAVVSTTNRIQFGIDPAVVASQSDLANASNVVRSAIPPPLTVITGGVSMGPPTTNVEVNGTSDIDVSASVVANTNRLAFGLSTGTSNRVQMALTNATSANAAFTSLLNSSNPAVVKTLSAGSNMTITDNGTNLVLASTGGGSGGGNWIGTRIGFNELFDDFLNSIQLTVSTVGEDIFGWIWGSLGAGSGTLPVDGSTNLPPAPGIMRMNTGTASTGYAYLVANYSTVAPLVFGQMAVTNVWRFRLSHLNNAGDSYTLRIGFGDDFDSESVDALGVRYTTNESHFIFYARNNSTESTITNTTTVASNTWYVAEIVVDSLAANATLRMGTTYAGLADSVTLTSNIPSGSGARSVGLWAMIQKDQGATPKYAELDFCYLAYKLNADR